MVKTIKNNIEKNKLIIAVIVLLMIDVFITKILLVFGADREIETTTLINNLDTTIDILKYSIAAVVGYVIRGSDKKNI